ncbi:aminoacyl-tRNA hydrolase [Allobranchiibius sp. CTAmp26]|nr:aminoacyl-tRNA hydrolase [Allobranchiibius sp. CTAmp26]MBO1753502.1 aminoacyl-tRNA hydrolase [Allobranchiibius sp. CTAmp26]
MPVDPWLIVGLGNPGTTYAGNRHNVGAMVAELLADRAGATLKAHKARARGAQIRLGSSGGGLPGPAAVVAVPSTYMNESGGPVAALLQFFKIPPERLIVVHDELDIDFGAVRLKRGGGEGGHNGLRSITKSLGTKDYLRVRVGIGRPPGRMDAASYVLKDFNATERKELDLLLPSAVDAIDLLVEKGLPEAQNVVHAW